MTGVRRQRAAAPAVRCLREPCGSALAQTPLTLEDAMKRAQGETADARALASAIDEADARIQRAQSGFWPRVDVTETVQRGNQPVFVFSSLLSQRRFTAANFAIPALEPSGPCHQHAHGRRRSSSRSSTLGLTRLGVEAAKLERDVATASRDAARQDLGFRAAQAFVRVLQLEATVRATDAAVAAAESDRQRARARRDVGLVTEADVLAVDVHLADMRQRQIAAAGDLAVARMQLAEAVGLPLTAAVVPVRPARGRCPPTETRSSGKRSRRTRSSGRRTSSFSSPRTDGARPGPRCCPGRPCRRVGSSTARRSAPSNRAGWLAPRCA